LNGTEGGVSREGRCSKLQVLEIQHQLCTKGDTIGLRAYK
jgi:hypothetical protein